MIRNKEMFIVIAFQLCFRICHQEGLRKLGRIGIDRTHQLLLCADDVSTLGGNINTIKKYIKFCKMLIRGWSRCKCREN
jgi:hypothetical protein